MTQPPHNSPERRPWEEPPRDLYDPYGQRDPQRDPYGQGDPGGAQRPYSQQQQYEQQHYGQQHYGQQHYGPGWPPYGQQPPYGGAGTYAMRYGYPDPVEDLAGRWARFGGGVLDWIIIFAIQGALVGPTIRWSHIGDAGYNQVDIVGGVGTLLAEFGALLIGFLYIWIQHAKWGQTLGKRAAGTRLVRAEDGGPVSWGQAAWRIGFSLLFGIVANVVTCGFGGWLALLDPAWILWDRRRQGLHDKVAKTLVVKVDPTGPDPYREL